MLISQFNTQSMPDPRRENSDSNHRIMRDASCGFLPSGWRVKKDQPTAEVKILEDDDGDRTAALEQLTAASSAENLKRVKQKIKLPKFKKGLKIHKGASDTANGASPTDEAAEDVKTPEGDGNGDGATAVEQQPVVPSADNQKPGKHKLKLPKFKKGPRNPKTAIETVDIASPREHSFKENMEQGLLKEAGRQLIAREELLFQRGSGPEGTETEAWEKQVDALQADYETLLVQVLLAIQNSFGTTAGEMVALSSAVGVVLQEEEQDRRWQVENGSEAPPWRPRQYQLTHDALLQGIVKKRMDNMEDVACAEKLSSSLKKDVCKMGKQVHADLLKVARDLKVCYPAKFGVCNAYARLYHQAFSSRLVKMTEFDLDLEDLIYLLSWAHVYYPNDILKHKELENYIDSEALGPLLPEAVDKALEEKYLQKKEGQVGAWLSSALKKEEKSWSCGELPELVKSSSDCYYFSPVAIDVIQLVSSAVKETKAIFGDTSRPQGIVCQLENFFMGYKKSLEELIKVNPVNTNPLLKANLASIQQLKEFLEKNVDLLPEDRHKTCQALLQDLEDTIFSYYLNVFHLELRVLYKQIWTQAWLATGVKQLVESLDCLISDCVELKSSCRQELMSRLHVQVMVEYVRRMMKGKLKLKSREQQEMAASLLSEDSEKLSVVFKEAGSGEGWLGDLLPKLAEVMKLQDPGSIQLEVITLAECYPDLSEKHIVVLLRLKNLSSSHIKRIRESLAVNRSAVIPENARSFFSSVPLSKWATII
ncbi:hypothetical protein GJAV_G00109110 [Gymnothorax javanicus]|nr:hypothetical protein GJAV_G00109110 [Gymnothorax javanicus]